MSSAIDEQKRAAGSAAADLVESGMLVGLGSGSTAAFFVAALAARLQRGELQRVRGVPTSEATARQARAGGIELVELTEEGLDLAVDGMDEVTADLDVVKGLGGALLREKIVAAAARHYVLIGDNSKVVDHLGQRSPVPVEVAIFGWRHTRAALSELAAEANLRLADGAPFVTDNGNHIVDCHLSGPFAPGALAATLEAVPGVVGHGLFLGLTDEALIAADDGLTRLTGAGATATPRSAHS